MIKTSLHYDYYARIHCSPKFWSAALLNCWKSKWEEKADTREWNRCWNISSIWCNFFLAHSVSNNLWQCGNTGLWDQMHLLRNSSLCCWTEHRPQKLRLTKQRTKGVSLLRRGECWRETEGCEALGGLSPAREWTRQSLQEGSSQRSKITKVASSMMTPFLAFMK